MVSIVVAAIADGGVDTPVVWALLLPLAFASLSYPLGSTVAVGATVVAGYDATVAVASRIQEALEARAPASLGTASHPADGRDAASLEHHADAALYACKVRRRGLAGSRARRSRAAVLV